jgi:integrase
MPRVNLTEKTVAKLPAPTKTGKPMLYWDNGPKAVRGFGVLCSGKSHTKSYIAQRDLPGGRSRRVTIAGVNEISLDEARKQAADMLVDMRRGLDPKAKKETLTLRSVLDSYRKAHAHRLRARSDESYRESVERYLPDWLDRPLVEITRDMVEKQHKQIAEGIEAAHRAKTAEAVKRYEAKAEKAKGWPQAVERYKAKAAAAAARKPYSGHATANATMRALRMLWNYAADKNPTIGPNPVRLKKEWFHVRRRTRLVRADDLSKFYEAMMALSNAVQRDYLRLILFTGLRRSEAAALRWDPDIDLKARVIRIPAPTTKADRKLDLPMCDVVHAMLVARRALGDTKYVFPADSGSGHVEEPKFACEQIAEACGVRISPHDLRRTFVTTAESIDMSTIALKALVNHALPDDVTSGYVVMTAERLREPAQKVCDKLKMLCGIVEPAGENVARLTG